MFTFVNPFLLGGLALVALPVLIHLINLLRQRRVSWAAMEFLLESQRKNSRWIRLRELLLLFLRAAMIAGVVLILAQPLSSDTWRMAFGGQAVDHVVLLDDSYSMSDHWADTTAFDQARTAILRLAESAAANDAPQTFTVVRFSQAELAEGSKRADLLQQRIDHGFAAQLAERVRNWRPSHLDSRPATALTAARELLGKADGARRIVYLFSDFRTKDWDEPGDLSVRLQQWSADGAQLEFVDCVDRARPNLAISALAPDEGTRAAGVPLSMNVTVRNYSANPVADLTVTVDQEGAGRAAVKFDKIDAGQSETRSFQVLFPTAGVHAVTARLASDAVAADNTRYAAIEMPIGVPVLVVASNPSEPDAMLVSAALNPGGATKTGIDVQVETPNYLNAHPLDDFAAVFLLDIDHLDDAAIAALTAYAQHGGGVAFFAGPRTNPDFINRRLYDEGRGIFPCPVVASTQLIVDRLEKIPDLSVSEHPIFKAFAGERNSFLGAVTVDRFLLVPKDWKPADRSVQVIARLRNGSPLAVERSIGSGHVVAFLSTAGPAWNNWSRNPSFVVTLLQLQAWLSQGSLAAVSSPVGSALELQLDPTRYNARAQFTPPADSAAPPTSVDLTVGADGLSAAYRDTTTAGLYEALLTETNGKAERRLWALNVDPEEGNLATLDAAQLAVRLPKLRYSFHRADHFIAAPRSTTGSNLSDALLYALVALLVGEQALAYAASYHPAGPREERR
ncbi:MAG TPA: BatA domain-containing protein [Pirellulales bacterium]|nr:BatA domain-containing protein [Pirellulales bacterium]